MPDDHDLCFSTTCFSHTLYFFYFIFFSPYLLKFIFFISFSPLFLTTTLLLILSIIATGLPHSKLGFVQTVVDTFQSKLNEDDDEYIEFEDFEIYEIVFRHPPLIMEDTVAEKERRLERLLEELDRFEDSTASIKMNEKEIVGELEPVMVTSSFSDDDVTVQNLFTVKPDSRKVDSTAAVEMKSDLENVVGELQIAEPVMVTSSISDNEQLTGQSSFTEMSNSSRFSSSSSFESYDSIEDSTDSTEIKTPSNYEELHKLQPVTTSISGEDKSNSRRLNDITAEVAGELQKLKPVTSSISVNNNKTVNNSSQFDSSSSFGSYGSMRNEKEWKRTLACKLFEERLNLEGGEEGMDSLWEAYETDNSSRKSQSTLKNKKKSEFKYFDDGEEDDNEFMSNGHLCCLKAFKLSTGKMNLGMGKPNLVKISKAFKGFGWLHHVASKHGKKN